MFIDYQLGEAGKAVSLKVVDATGKAVREFTNAPKTAGFHRISWALNRGSGEAIPATRAGGGRFGGGGGQFGGGGAPLIAGQYRVSLTVDGKEFSQMITVENDPTVSASIAAVEEQEEEEDEEEKEKEAEKALLKKKIAD